MNPLTNAEFDALTLAVANVAGFYTRDTVARLLATVQDRDKQIEGLLSQLRLAVGYLGVATKMHACELCEKAYQEARSALTSSTATAPTPSDDLNREEPNKA